MLFPSVQSRLPQHSWAIFSAPQMAMVGLTEVQARYQYADDVLVLQQYFKTVAAAQLSAETTGILN